MVEKSSRAVYISNNKEYIFEKGALDTELKITSITDVSNVNKKVDDTSSLIEQKKIKAKKKKIPNEFQESPELDKDFKIYYGLPYRKMILESIQKEFYKNDFSFKTSIFHRNSDNMIDRVRNTPPTVTTDKWINQNIGTNITDGIEMEASQYIPSIQSSFSASYTYLDNKNNSPYAYSRYVSENLKRQFVAKMENKLFKNFYSQLIYRHNQRQIDNSSYNLLDEKLSFRKNNFEAFVLINNITNSNYTEGFGIPMPKRWAHIGVSYIIK